MHEQQTTQFAGSQRGFTLIELMIVVAIIGTLASFAIPAMQTYAVRAQVAEGITLATNAKSPIFDWFVNNGEAPLDRATIGMTANPEDTSGNYVTSVEVTNGTITVTFGNSASAVIDGTELSLTPYETPGLGVVWRCGSSPVPAGLELMGHSAGGAEAAYAAPTVPARYLPRDCR